MTAAVPDPREDGPCATPGCGHKLGSHLWPRHGGGSCKRCDCDKFVAAVPDPRFRDQLAEEIGRHQGLRGPMDSERPDVWQNRCECGWDDGDERPGWRERYRQHIADALLLLVEARVQAAGDQRAAEEQPQPIEGFFAPNGEQMTAVPFRDHAAALASPAPAPHVTVKRSRPGRW